MIGAVGGTMGLCIGFSFREVSGVLFRYIGIGIKKVQNVSATNEASVVKDLSRNSIDQSQHRNQICSEE